jgi:hypothetical protein
LARFSGSRSGAPPASPAQNRLTGHRSHRGDFGRQITAPRSMVAWAQSPGRTSEAMTPARRRNSGLASGSGVSTANRRETTRSTLPSTTTAAGWSKAMAATAAAV